MELLSLLAAFFACFVAIPLVVSTHSNDGPWFQRAGAGFLGMSVFFRVAVMFVGLLGANLPGITVALWIAWCMACLIWSGGRRAPEIGIRLQNGFLRLLQAIETRKTGALRLRLPFVSRTSALFCLLVSATFLERAWYPLHNLRFARIETYSRTLDLQKFMHGDAPFADGAAYILQPLGVFSGLYPDSVIRLSGPLFSVLLVLAVAFCAFRFVRSTEAALIAAALMAAWPVIAGIRPAGEIGSSEIAAVYWVLGAAFMGRSWHWAVCAFSMALLTSWKIPVILGAAAVSVALAYAFVRLSDITSTRLRSISAGAVTGFVVLLLLADCDSQAAEGPFEYEAAARACHTIATQFPRRQWLIISPVQELAYTYGRGWHFELLDFVSTHSIEQITPREFSIPYDVRDIFIFIEKQPLQGKSVREIVSFDLTQNMDRAILAYYTGLGRTSIEFQSGELLAAYGVNHRDISTFHEDERFVVLHIHKQPDLRPATKAASEHRGL